MTSAALALRYRRLRHCGCGIAHSENAEVFLLNCLVPQGQSGRAGESHCAVCR